MPRSFGWKPGARLPGSAQAVGERVEALRDELGGSVTPEDLVADARDEKSPLHRLFEWDDSVAAEQYRLTQARKIIRSVVVVRDEGEATVRAFVAVPSAAKSSRRCAFTSVEAAMADPTQRAFVLARARAELQAWAKRYQDLEEFAAILRLVGEEAA